MKKIVLSSLLVFLISGCSQAPSIQKETYSFNSKEIPYIGMEKYIPVNQRRDRDDQLEKSGLEYEIGDDLILLKLTDEERDELIEHNKQLIEEATTYYQDNVNSSFTSAYDENYRNLIYTMDSYEYVTKGDMDEMYELAINTFPLSDITNLVQMNSVLIVNPDCYVTIEVINSTNNNHVIECLYPAMDFSMKTEDWELSKTEDHRSTVVFDEAFYADGIFDKIENNCLYFTVTDSNFVDKDWVLYFELHDIYVPYTFDGMKVSIRKKDDKFLLTKENKEEDGTYKITKDKPQKIKDIIYYYGQ